MRAHTHGRPVREQVECHVRSFHTHTHTPTHTRAVERVWREHNNNNKNTLPRGARCLDNKFSVQNELLLNIHMNETSQKATPGPCASNQRDRVRERERAAERIPNLREMDCFSLVQTVASRTTLCSISFAPLLWWSTTPAYFDRTQAELQSGLAAVRACASLRPAMFCRLRKRDIHRARACALVLSRCSKSEPCFPILASTLGTARASNRGVFPPFHPSAGLVCTMLVLPSSRAQG